MTINGQVAEILDKYTLAANIGGNDGVEEGMKFEVYEEGPIIRDPETNERLGRPETVKATVVAKDVKDKLSIMETETTTSSFSFSAISLLAGQTRQKKMKTDESVKEDRKKVEVGDSLRQVTEEDEDGEENGSSESST